jgi:hypothetical protein
MTTTTNSKHYEAIETLAGMVLAQGLESLSPLERVLTRQAWFDLCDALEVCPVHVCDVQICQDDQEDCQLCVTCLELDEEDAEHTGRWFTCAKCGRETDQ